MWVRSGRDYASVPLWMGQSIPVLHRGAETQRICDSSSPILNSEEPFISLGDCNIGAGLCEGDHWVIFIDLRS